MKRFFLIALSITIALAATGCSRMFHKKISTDNLQYNRGVNKSINQQLLVNIVRAHFHESALYVTIENVTSRHTYEDEASLSFFHAFAPVSPRSTATLAGETKVSAQPSFIYTPQTNDKYAIELLQPLRLKALYLVVESESDIGYVLRLMLRRMDQYVNFEPRPLIRSYHVESEKIKRFVMLTQIINKIYSANDYTAYFIKGKSDDDDDEKIEIPMPHDTKLTPAEWHLLASIHIYRGDPYILLCASHDSIGKKDVIHIQVRSLLNVMDFLAFAVEDPPGLVVRPHSLYSNRYQYQRFKKLLTQHMINILASSSKPVNPFVAVKKYGYWYYIDNNDVTSKITFRLFRVFNDLTQADTGANNILISS